MIPCDPGSPPATLQLLTRLDVRLQRPPVPPTLLTYPHSCLVLQFGSIKKPARLPSLQAAVAAAILQPVRQNASGREACAARRGRRLQGEGRVPGPGDAAGSSLQVQRLQSRRRGPRGSPSGSRQPRDLPGKTVKSAGPAGPAPPLSPGPSRSRAPGRLQRTPPPPPPPRNQHGLQATHLHPHGLLLLLLLLPGPVLPSASNLPPPEKALKPTTRLPPPPPSPGVEGKRRAGSASRAGRPEVPAFPGLGHPGPP